MLLCFLDDSKRNNGWFARGGFVIKEENFSLLENDFYETLKFFNIPVDQISIDKEVKWSPDRGNWIKDNLKGCERIKLQEKILLLLEKYSSVLFLTAISKYYDEKTRLENCFIHTFERVNFYARSINDSVKIVCDRENCNRSTNKINKELLELIQKGSEYQKLESIDKPINMVDSKICAGIQTADLIVGITLDLISLKENPYAEKLWPILRGKYFFMCESRDPQRYGLSILPDNERKNFVTNYNPYDFNYTYE